MRDHVAGHRADLERPRSPVSGVPEAPAPQPGSALNREVRAGSAARALKVSGPTKRVALSREDGADESPRIAQAPAHLHRLVGGDTPADAEDDPLACEGRPRNWRPRRWRPRRWRHGRAHRWQASPPGSSDGRSARAAQKAQKAQTAGASSTASSPSASGSMMRW